jgi:uncharacterized hydrophobic protein (TIGR00271 family)
VTVAQRVELEHTGTSRWGILLFCPRTGVVVLAVAVTPGSSLSIARLQDRVARLLGTSAEGRGPLVARMLRRDAGEATSYWLPLLVSVGIATLGLVVGSSAVVIGAMLVAPLMGPIIGLAMGLATGSPFLVLRSGGRIGLSLLAAVGGAAAITLMLPFHELNAEILARTSPTVLDLITAGFCALAGVYASLRPGSDTAATAAGTSISISLVPPLCASGYGVGTLDGSVARGAALLFLTNLVAIVVIGTASFVAAGFNRVDVVTLERDELQAEGRVAPIASALAQRLSRVFESRGGPVLRFLMPFLLLGAVYIPLGRALDEVAWQVRVRSAVRESLADDTLRVVQSRVRVERQEVEIVVVLLGSAEDADSARTRLDTDIRRASGVVPRIEVLAVPDATAFAGLESTLLTPQRVATALPTAPPPSPAEQLTAAQARVRSMVNELWPAAASGPALVVELGTAEQGPLSVRVVHLGAPLGPDGVDALRRALGRGLGREVRMVDVAVPAEPLTRADGDLRLVARVARGAAALATVPGSSVCVSHPGADAGSQGSAPTEVALTLALDDALAAHPRVTMEAGSAWSVRFVRGECPAPPAPLAPDAGTTD